MSSTDDPARGGKPHPFALGARSGRPYDYEAFVPALLGERLLLKWPSDLVELVTRAGDMIGRLPSETDLGGLSVHLGRAEASGSSMIEGHYVRARRLFEMQLDPETSTDREAVPVYSNFEMLSEARRDQALTLDSLLRWHRLLMAHDPRAMPGHLREVQNWIGGDSFGPLRASFVPPPPGEVHRLMSDLSDYANLSLDHPVLKAAVLHAQFETIHPFIDGNGRVGRALIHWALRHAQASVPPLALVWYAHGDRYYHSLGGWRNGHDPTPWITYFASSLIESVGASEVLLARLSNLRERWLALTRPRPGSLKEQLVQDLVTNPIVDADSAAGRVGADRTRFSRVARELETIGVLTSTRLQHRKGGRPANVYEARAVFDVLNAFVDEFRVGRIPGRPGDDASESVHRSR